MNIPKTAGRLKKFMEATEREVVDLFMTLPGAEALKYTNPDTPIVFVPGHRKDRVLLVAHYDTVFTKPVKVGQLGSYLVSMNKGVGIGADDRAGCCALWMLRTLGHSLLLVPDEEVGCRGSGYAAEHHVDKLKDHSFCIEFDRAGSRDLVYYDMETDPFEEYIEEAFPGYEHAQGSFTDIVELCPALDIAGVNLSIGYDDQHTANEHLDVMNYIRTVYLAMNMLQRTEIPSFQCGETYSAYTPTSWNGYNYGYKRDQDDDDLEAEQAPFGDKSDLEFCEVEEAEVIICPHCLKHHHDMTSEMWVFDYDQALCGYCNKDFDLVNNCYRSIDLLKDDETNTYTAGVDV